MAAARDGLFPSVFGKMSLRGTPVAGIVAGASMISVLALLYSLWAISGTGPETVLWGLVLMMAGLPIYWWQERKRRVRP